MKRIQFEAVYPWEGLTRSQRRLLASTEKQVLVAGGFGSGKTTAIGIKLIQLKADNPGVPGLLMAQSWRALWSITLRRLMSTVRRVLPPGARMPRVCDRQGECYLDFGDGVPVFLRSAHDPGTFDGLDVGWGCGDDVLVREQPGPGAMASPDRCLIGTTRLACYGSGVQNHVAGKPPDLSLPGNSGLALSLPGIGPS